MTTPAQIRCKHCAYLVEDEQSGAWICTAYEPERDIEQIKDEDCPSEAEQIVATYVEPADYFPQAIRKKYKLGEYNT